MTAAFAATRQKLYCCLQIKGGFYLVKHSRIIFVWLIVVLMFCILSTGGCGGSSSSGGSDTANENFAHNPENGDYGHTDPDDDDDDDYDYDYEDEAVKPNKLAELNGTKWRIMYAYVDGITEIIPETQYNFNISEFTFVTTNDSFALVDETGQYHNEPLTVTIDDHGHTVTIPVIQAADGFEESGGMRFEAKMNTGRMTREVILNYGRDSDTNRLRI